MKKNILLFIVVVILTTFFLFINDKPSSKIIVKLRQNDKIINLSLEEYVLGVVAAEMPASFETEALKAQAIASRTFIYEKIETNPNYITTIIDQAYINDAQMKEKWGKNYFKYYTKLKEIVKKTKYLIITYNNQVIKSYYYAMSNGYSESEKTVFNETLEYLEIVESKWDYNVNKFEVTKTYSIKDFCQKLSLNFCNNIIFSDYEYTESHRLKSIKINNFLFTGLDLRKKLSLRSTDMNFSLKNSNIIITTKGYGHGVGMSQYGANEMAKSKYTYEQILKHYYQNVEINNLYNV